MADADGNRYGPYDIEVPGSESEALTEDAWFDLFGHISGVKSGGALTFNGLTATLAPIDARVHGSYLIRQDPWSDASPATTTSAPRRDLLVARRQRTSGEGAGATPGKTFLTVLRGTPATTPADPAHDPDDDEPLWSWQVPGNGGTVVTGIRDLRGVITAAGGPKAFVSFTARNVHFPAPARGDMCTVNGVTHTHDGTGWRFRLSFKMVAVVTNASGLHSFSHGAGQAPRAWGADPLNQATDVLNTIIGTLAFGDTSSTLTTRCTRSDNNTYLVSNTVSYSVWADF